jgi:uncharacterized protein (DUF2267 family)
MKYDEFISQVSKRANIDSREAAERAVAATLETLGQRLAGGEPKDLASQLPPEIAMFLQQPDSGSGEAFSVDEFFWRVSQREGVDLTEATFHARVILGLLSESVTMGEIQNVQAQLPNDFAQLFDVQNEGSLPAVDSLPESLE